MEPYISEQNKESLKDRLLRYLKFWQNWPVKKILLIAGVLILLIAIGIAVWLTQQQQIFRSKASSGEITVSLIPQNINLNINEPSIIDVKITAGTNKIVGVDLVLEYGDELEALEFIPKEGNFDTIIIPGNEPSIDSIQKLVRYLAINQDKNSKESTFLLGTFKFKAISLGSGKISIQKAQIITEGGESGFSVNSSSVATYIIGQPTTSLAPTETAVTITPIIQPSVVLSPTLTPTLASSPSPSPISTLTPTLTPTPIPSLAYGCTASYDLNPKIPSPSSTFTINVSSSDSSNYNCVVLYQDNTPASCKIGSGVGNYTCTAFSGGSGNHTLQLKFGQTEYYPQTTNCGNQVECAPITYQTVE